MREKGNIMAQTILEEKKKSRLMTEGSIWKSILLFSVPLILGNMLQQLYNTADSIIVGNFVGANALAAVGNIAPINSFAIGAAFGLTAGFTIPVAQCFGAGDQEETNRQAGNGIGLSLITGVLFSALALLVLHPMLGWIHTPKEIWVCRHSCFTMCLPVLPAALGIAKSPCCFC